MRAETTQPAAAKFAALYCRVSTTDQGERYSLPSQLKRLHEMASGDGYTVKPEHVFVDQFSGKTATRPAFERLRALVKTGAIQAVLVLSVDRFARRVEDAAATFAEFKRHNVLLDFAEMRMEDSASSRFMFNTMCAMAEYMGEKILNDSTRGRKQKLESGKLTHGSAKFGYTYIDKRQPDGARLEIDPKKAEVVKNVFRWRIEGMSMYGIAKRLNTAGILSAGYNGKPGGLWSKTTIQQMLKSRTYTGAHVCSGVTVAVPRIIDDETFRTVLQRMAEDRQRLVGRPSNKYLLRGFLWCAKCARRCTTNPNSGYPNYRCNNVEYKPYRRICFASQIRQTTIEVAAWNSIWSVLNNPALLLELGKAYYDALPKSESDGAEALEREAARLNRRIGTTRRMMRDSAIAYADGLTAIRQDEARIRQIETELGSGGRVVSLPPLRAVEATVREITTGPEPKTYERKRDILEGILDLRLNYFDGDLEITGKIPMPEAAASSGGSQKNRHRRVRADSEGERQHGHDREQRVLA